MRNKKILITGGAGFIGSNLSDELIRLGNEVIVVDDLSTGKKEYIDCKAKFYQVDIRSKKISEIFKKESLKRKIDFVFHLAAQIDVRKSIENSNFDNEINVLGGLNILENCYRHKIKKIIFSSSGGAVYGDASIIPTAEDYLPEPISPYGIHKLTFEKYLNYYYKVYGQKYISLRFSNVYGPHQFKGGEAGVIAIFINNAINNKKSIINGNGLQTRDFIYVGDVVKSLIDSAKSDYVGEINIGATIETNLLQMVEIIESILDCKIKKEFGPAKKGEQMRSCLNCVKAKKVLKWESKTKLEDGIRQTIKWSKK